MRPRRRSGGVASPAPGLKSGGRRAGATVRGVFDPRGTEKFGADFFPGVWPAAAAAASDESIMANKAQQPPHLHLAEVTASQFLDIWKHFDADGRTLKVITNLWNMTERYVRGGRCSHAGGKGSWKEVIMLHPAEEEKNKWSLRKFVFFKVFKRQFWRFRRQSDTKVSIRMTRLSFLWTPCWDDISGIWEGPLRV